MVNKKSPQGAASRAAFHRHHFGHIHIARLLFARFSARAFFAYGCIACAFFLTSCQTSAGAEKKSMPDPHIVSSDPQIIAQTSLMLYRSVISTQDDSRCVFTPTCSRYMEEALQKHGIAGFLMGIDRLTRCHGMNLKPGTCYEILKDGTLYDPVK